MYVTHEKGRFYIVSAKINSTKSFQDIESAKVNSAKYPSSAKSNYPNNHSFCADWLWIGALQKVQK